MVAVAASATGGSTCGMAIIRTVRTSNNDASLSQASNGVGIIRMPQNTLLTGYQRIAEVSFNGTSYDPVTAEYVISTAGQLGNITNFFC
jgi:hypothetical protein